MTGRRTRWLVALILFATAAPSPATGDDSARTPRLRNGGAERRGDWYEGVALAHAPVAALRRQLVDWDHYVDWFPGLSSMRILERRGSGAVVHARHDLPWPLRDRDYVVEYALRERADGGFELRARSIQWPAAPVAERVVRLLDVESLWTVSAASPDTTRVVYAVREASESALPRWLGLPRFRSDWQAVTDALSARLTE